MAVKSLEGWVLLSNSHQVALADMNSRVEFGCWKSRHFLSHGLYSAWEREVSLLKERNRASERLVDTGGGMHSCCIWGKGKEQADFSHVDPRQVRSVWEVDGITSIDVISFH